MDVSRHARFEQPGHAVTGDRSHRTRGWMRPETRVGYDYAHAVVDDHSRLAYVELHADERAQTVTGFVERALAFFEEHGVIAKRLMTDNAFAYVKNRSLRALLAERDIRHLTTQAYRPRTNRKVERFRRGSSIVSRCSPWHNSRAIPISQGRRQAALQLLPVPATIEAYIQSDARSVRQPAPAQGGQTMWLPRGATPVVKQPRGRFSERRSNDHERLAATG
jgi:hypothetical protein